MKFDLDSPDDLSDLNDALLSVFKAGWFAAKDPNSTTAQAEWEFYRDQFIDRPIEDTKQ